MLSTPLAIILGDISGVLSSQLAYPPDKSKKVLETVLKQAELMCGNVDYNEEQWETAAEDKEKY